jgi:hypothetical protein
LALRVRGGQVRFDHGPVMDGVGNTKDDAISLNLAHLRHEGAKIGANEVHIHLLADTAHERALVEADLTAAHMRRHIAQAA